MTRMKLCLLSLTAIVVFAAATNALPLASAPQVGFPIITGSTDQAFPSLVYNGLQSEFLLVYEDRLSASQFQIKAQRLDAQGAPISEPVIVVETPKQHRKPRAAINRSNGEYLVVWFDDDVNNGVFGRRLSALAEPLGDIVVIAAPNHGEQSAAVAYSPSPPHYLSAWMDYRNVSADIFAQQLSATGQLLSGNISVSLAPQSQFTPAVVYNDFSGLFFVAWGDRRLGSGAVDIYGRFVTNDGALWGTEILICSAGYDQWTPAVTVNEQNGDMLVAWQDERNAPQTYNVYGQRLSFTGALLGGNFPLSAIQSNHQASPNVAYGSGVYLVSWEDMRAPGQETNDIYGRWFSNDGTAIGLDLAITTDPDDQASPASVYHPDSNRFLVVWANKRGLNDRDIYGLFFDTPAPPSTSTPTSTPTFTRIPTHTPTSTPTRTPTHMPTSTPTITPTRTRTPTPTATPTQTPVGVPNLFASTKSASPTVVAYFEDITYTIIVRNTGSAAATVNLSDQPPLPYMAGSVMGGIWWDDAAGLIRWQGTIAAGDSRLFQFQVRGPTPPIAHNTIYTNRVTLDDGVNPPIERSVDVLANPAPTPTATPTPTLTPTPRFLYLPVVQK